MISISTSIKIVLLLMVLLLSLLRKSVVAFITPMSSSPSSSSSRVSLTSLAAGKIKIEDILKTPQWPEKWPFKPADFSRQDPSDDNNFYGQPRLVYHIDDGAVKALTNFYKANIKPNTKVLDICSSWVSHYPTDVKLDAVGLGMNEYELSQNKQDLNKSPVMPFPDNTFDYVTCVVSVDYLTRPLEIFSEIGRVLKPQGTCFISQSNRCFPTKAIDIWLKTNDYQHIFIIGSYFHYSTKFNPPASLDISPGFGDPMYIIQATKK